MAQVEQMLARATTGTDAGLLLGRVGAPLMVATPAADSRQMLSHCRSHCSVPCGAWPPLVGACAVAVIASGFLLWISAGAAALLGAFAGTITVCATALGWFRACQNCWEACRMENQRIWNQWLQQQQLQRGAA